MSGGNIVPSVTAGEHIGPTATGDNIEAKRIANYGWGTDNTWQRIPLPLIDKSWDTVDFSDQDSNGNYQTITFKNGLDTARTLALTFDASSNVTSIGRT